MLPVLLLLALAPVALAVWCAHAWRDRRACETGPERGEPRFAVYLLRYGPADTGVEDNLEDAASYVGKANEVADRFANHQDESRWTARDQRWKGRIAWDRSTVLRYCRTEAEALEVESRVILTFAVTCRTFGPLLRRPRWVPNVQGVRAPKDMEEWAKVAVWFVWYAVLWPGLEYRARRLLRLPAGPGSRDERGDPGIDGRWLWPWPKEGRVPLVQTPPPPEARVRTRA